jgi:hypothetical protein
VPNTSSLRSPAYSLCAGPSRNFQVFDPLDLLAEVTQHIPDAGEHLLLYYGWYSNKSRGQRAKTPAPTAAGTGLPGGSPSPNRRTNSLANSFASRHLR